MTTFLEAESSVQDGSPRELIEISINDVTTYHHTSASRDIAYGGQLYTAIALDRGEVAITMPGDEKEMVLTLPVDHPLARRYTRYSNPPRKVVVTLRRQIGDETEIIFLGDCTSMSAEGRTAKFRIPSRAGEWMARPLPPLTVGVQCPYVLYGTACGVSRSGQAPNGTDHMIQTTIMYVNGRDVRVDLGNVARNGTWAPNGELVHVASGERSTIAAQTDLNPGISAVADLELALPIPELKTGDTVQIFRGCDGSIGTCNAVFANRQRFGGLNMKPDIDLFTPLGDGAKGAR